MHIDNIFFLSFFSLFNSSEIVYTMTIVGYAISISLGKTFALKHSYKVESNQVGKSE